MPTDEQEFFFDEDNPSTIQTFVVPYGLEQISLWVNGGGTEELGADPQLPLIGVRGTATVAGGDVITVLVGGASNDLEGGANGGGAGGGGFPGGDVFRRGSGGGGATQVWRNGELWIVAGGQGGNSGILESVTTVGPAPVPGEDEAPRSLEPAFFSSPYDELPGEVGGETDGGDGVLYDVYGSGGGGGGYGGGASGSIFFYEPPNVPFTGGEVVPHTGRNGGCYVTADVDQVPGWVPRYGDGPSDPLYGHGWVRFAWERLRAKGWSVGVIKF